MRIVLMINDNFHDNNLVRQLCLKYPSHIKGVVVSAKLFPGGKRSYFFAALYVLQKYGLGLFFLRGTEAAVYIAKHYLKFIGLYPDHFDIKHFCSANKIPIFICADINVPEFVDKFKSLQPDIVFSQINQTTGKELLAATAIGMVNSHLSLLPEYPGADPVFWGMVNGDEEFGVTYRFINEIPDSGNIIRQICCSGFGKRSLHFRESVLNEISASYLPELLASLETGKISAYPMPMHDANRYSLTTNAAHRKFKKNGCGMITMFELGKLVFNDGVKCGPIHADNQAKMLLKNEFSKFILRHEPGYFLPLVKCFEKHLDITGKNILEFGCGTGDLSFLLLECGAQSVLGVDIAYPAIQSAQVRAERQNLKNARFICGDVLEISLAPGSIDAVVSHSALQYLTDDWQPYLRQLYATLSQGGVMIATIEATASILKPIQTFNLYLLPESIKRHLHLLFGVLLRKKPKDEIIRGKSRYLGIPPLSIRSNGELMAEFAKAGFSKVHIVDSVKLHVLSRPHLIVIAQK
ncbi:MAG: hypothetical protein A2X34_08950 [Elusimicrobia bacterium GWC2_51_8]|nr:MAG: hypothetical protein A2X33_01245 [Elusimicrobia bacterium GWA2_51_34]OGR58150.1 MAG: hypothetical protein A2X34_08950 [Elusimicrobia bacterium GWC2_51_8]OGR86427.1 MAG: hypothetical protein A2021_07430 [Elusimicrobia bacterium GWF2_52_66]HAF96153.1 hypothetical protein [Elusimicrobiota bacterium]HCE97763.1 hypothetical protein [Elusimicrobiota bacterium]